MATLNDGFGMHDDEQIRNPHSNFLLDRVDRGLNDGDDFFKREL
jgi:hypothetical protein